MNFSDLQKDIQKKQFKPVYILHGEESYYIDELVASFEKWVLTEEEKSFNQSILYGKEIEFKQVLDAAKQFPMMAERRLVIVKEAQELKTLENLATYFERPVPSTVLVIAHKYKSLDKRKKWVKTLENAASALVFESTKIKDTQLNNWISNYIQERRYKAEPQVVEVLAQSLGNDLGKISNELDKLFINIPPSQPITSQLVQQYIGISKDYNVFELQSALGRKDATKALQIVNHFCKNPKDNPMPAVTAILYGYFSKLYALSALKSAGHNPKDKAKEVDILPFLLSDYENALKFYNRLQLEQVLAYLLEYDLRSKGVAPRYKDDMLYSENTDYDGLLTELVYKILYG